MGRKKPGNPIMQFNFSLIILFKNFKILTTPAITRIQTMRLSNQPSFLLARVTAVQVVKKLYISQSDVSKIGKKTRIEKLENKS